jgi:hypothetical protein
LLAGAQGEISGAATLSILPLSKTCTTRDLLVSETLVCEPEAWQKCRDHISQQQQRFPELQKHSIDLNPLKRKNLFIWSFLFLIMLFIGPLLSGLSYFCLLLPICADDSVILLSSSSFDWAFVFTLYSV